jgi:hypothetical protein
VEGERADGGRRAAGERPRAGRRAGGGVVDSG